MHTPHTPQTSSPLFDRLPQDVTQRLSFAGRTLDPKAEKRGDDAVELALGNSRARFLLLCQNKLLMQTGKDGTHKVLFSAEDVKQVQPAFAADLESLILLGVDDAAKTSSNDGTPYLSLTLSLDIEALPELGGLPLIAAEYRALYTQNLVSPEIAGMVAQAASLSAWHRTHKFCGRCGTQTQMRTGGYKRVCTGCHAEHFPRTDPVVIMLVTNGDQCLLARSPHFAPFTYSCLAGFMEPGETIEAAVRRETREEMGVPVGHVAYYASQPWPFPYSLMIGCHAQALSNDYQVDYEELEDGRWFSRDEVKAMLDGSHPDGLRTPPEGAIASVLIHAWVNSEQ